MFDGIAGNPLHWVILLVVVLIIFGPGKLPGVGSALGQSLREFKKASRDDGPAQAVAIPPALSASVQVPALTSAAPATCSSCGQENDSGARFCSHCGVALSVEEAPPEEDPPSVSVVAPAAQAGPVTCSSCQTINPASNRFCAHCGRLIEQALEHV
jgi:sec-independent protein translocase protein TatA